MTDERAQDILETLGRALARLKEALDTPVDSSIILDATIQRFEFTVELYWKTLKALLSLEKFEVNSPKAALRKAYAQGWLDDEQLWLKMADDRNLSSHVYNESTAREIYDRIQKYYPVMMRTYAKLPRQTGREGKLA